MIRLTLTGAGYIWIRPDTVESVRGFGAGSAICFHGAEFMVNERPEEILEMIRSGATPQ